MKAHIGIRIITIAVALFSISSASYAADRVKAEDAELKRLAELKAEDQKKCKNRMVVIEMGESGQTVAFPMTAAEIAAEDAELKRLAELKAKDQKKCMESGVVWGESS